MSVLGLDRETVFDTTVNLIPVGILLLLDLLFLVVNPWGWDLWFVFWMHFLTLFPLALLLVLTYVSGRVIERDEARLKDLEPAASHSAPSSGTGSGSASDGDTAPVHSE